MYNRNFKIFETINRYKKIYEAIQNEMEQGGDATEPAQQEVPQEQPQQEAGDNPEEQASPENGIFISDNQKADLAKIMLDALQMTPPEPGTIPAELMNVTTDNADAVIKYIQSLNSLDGPLSLKNDSNENSLAGALKDI